MSETPAGLILIAENETSVARSLETYFHHNHFRTERAHDGYQTLTLLRHSEPDLVVLDAGLPKLDGWEVLRRIRRQSNTPVIMTTSQTDELERLLGLGLGADDVMVKPFSFREAVARVKAVLRRTQHHTNDTVVHVGALSVDMRKAQARLGATPIALTPTEFKLLYSLATAPDRVFSRAELIEHALPNSNMLERTVDSHLKNLRRKLRHYDHSIKLETVRGMGYKLHEVSHEELQLN